MILQMKQNNKHFSKVNAFCQVILQVCIQLLRKFGNTKSNEISYIAPFDLHKKKNAQQKILHLNKILRFSFR